MWLESVFNIRTPSINAQCRSMPIKIMALIRNASQCRSSPINANLGAKSWHWSEMPIDADHCRSMLININLYQCQSMPDQFCLIWHWSTLVGIERNWSALIDIGINARILSGIGHWSGESCNIVPLLFIPGIKYDIGTGCCDPWAQRSFACFPMEKWEV